MILLLQLPCTKHEGGEEGVPLGKSIFTWENSAEKATHAAKREQARMLIGK